MNRSRTRLQAAIALALVAVHASGPPAHAYPGDVFQNGAAAVAPSSNDTAESGDAAYGVSDQGGAQYTIPIVVPPGRQGMAPSLALSYSSRAPVRGGLASGWSLAGLPRIEVDTSRGRLGGATYRTSSGARLILVNEAEGSIVKTFRAERDDTFTRYERVQKYSEIVWIARTLDGQTLYFGESELSRDIPHTASASGARGARWFLTRSVDRFGNEVRYTYKKAWSLIRNETTLVPVDIYPTSIEWGGHSDPAAGFSPHARVVFDYAAEDRCEGSWVPIGASMSWRTGFPLMEGARRLNAIRVQIGSGGRWHERRRYSLGYDKTELGCRPGKTHAPLRLLTSVQERASAPDGTVVSLPAITFDYGRRELELTAQTAMIPIGSGANAQALQKAGGWPTLDSMLLDLDGDGRLDLLWSKPLADEVGCGATWQRNRGDGSFEPEAEFLLPTNPWRGTERDDGDEHNLREGCSLSHQFSRAETDDQGCGLAATYTSYRFMDVTGDGRPDLVTAIDANQGRYQPADDDRLWADSPILSCEDDAGACRDDAGAPMRCAISAPRPPNLTFAPVEDDDDGGGGAGCPEGMCMYAGCDPEAGACDCSPENCESEDALESAGDEYAPLVDQIEAEDESPEDVRLNFWQGPPYSFGVNGGDGRIPLHQNYACAQQPEEQCGRFVWRVYSNTGNGFAQHPDVLLSPIPLESDRATSSLGAGSLAASSSWHGFLDMDGDGFMDAVFMKPFWAHSGLESGPPPQSFQVFRGDGTGAFHGDASGAPYLWAAPTIPSGETDDYRARVRLSSSHPVTFAGLSDDKVRATSTVVTLEDVNGDGLPDYVDARDLLDRPGHDRVRVFYNTGTGFETDYRGSTLEVPGWGTETLPDAGQNQQYVLDWRANGQLDRGWSRDVRRMVDIDADGLLDLVVLPAVQYGRRNPWRLGEQVASLYVNVGDRLVPMGATSKVNQWWPALARIRLTDGGIHGTPRWSLETDFVDLDGDGLPEAFNNDQYADWCTPDPDTFGFIPPCGGGDRSLTTPRDGQGMRLLRTVRNGLGAKVDFTYGPLTAGRVPHALWTVRSMRITPGGGAPWMVTSYAFADPVYSQDDRGDWDFRGFATTRTTSPGGATTVKRFDHVLDWTGPLVETRVVAAGGHLANLVKTSWERRTLFDGRVTTLHPTHTETRTCGASQTAAACEASGDVRVDETIWTELRAGSIGLAHAVAEQISHPGEALMPGSKRVVQQHLLAAGEERYRLLPLVEERFTADDAAAWVQTGKTKHGWDASLRVEEATTVYADAASPATTTQAYDLVTGNLTGVSKPEQAEVNAWSNVVYDPTGVFVVHTTNELGHQVDATWDVATGAQLSSRGPNTKANGTKEGWSRRIDGFGRTVEESVFVDDGTAGYVAVPILRTTYGDVPSGGLRTTSTSRRIELTEDRWTADAIVVDGLGRTVKTSQIVGGVEVSISRNHYDAAGQRARAELPTPQTSGTGTVIWTFAYDSLGRQREAIGPDQAGQRWIYDGRQTTREDVLGPAGGVAGSTITRVDGFGRLVEVVELTAEGHTALTRYGYDGNDALSAIEDADGVVTTMLHDWRGQRVAIERGDRTWKYTYDRNGRLIGTIAPRPPGADTAAYTTTIVYDLLDREESRLGGSRDLDAGQLAAYGAAYVKRGYDGAPTNNGTGRLSFISQPWGTTTFQYEARGLVSQRRVKLKVPDVGVATGRTERTEYNALGAPRRMIYADGAMPTASTMIALATDDRGLPVTTTWSNTGQQLASYAYTAAGAVSSRTLAGMYEHAIGRDPRGRVTSHEVRARIPSTGVLGPRVAVGYAYDGSGAVEAMTWGLGPDGTLATETFDFAYDPQHQLIAATGPAGYDAAFVYSDAGRVRSATVDAAPDAVGVASREVTYEYELDGDPESPDKLWGPAGTWLDLRHDLSGNTTWRNGPDGTWTHVHDGFEHQREVSGPSGREVYWYDGDGQRVGVATYDAGGMLERVRWNFGAAEVWYAPDGTVEKTIAHVGPARIENGDRAEYVFADHYGHTLAVINQTGAMLAGFVYGPFGEILRQAGSEVPEVLRRFNGKEHDERSGLIYYGYRYFDPLSLTWTQADPLYRLVPDIAWDEPRRMSSYAFSLNNALRYVDPNGLSPEDDEARYFEYMDGGYTPGEAEALVGNNVPPDVAFAMGDPRNVTLVEGLAAGAAPWLPVVDAGRTLVPGVDAAMKGLQGDYGGALASGASDVFAAVVGFGVGKVGGAVVRWGVNKIAARGAAAGASAALGRLTSIGNGQWQSTAGLIYGQGSVHGNRVKHVLAHAAANSKKAKHSVFVGGRAGVLPAIDRAWAARGVGVVQKNGNTLYHVHMGGEIVGTAGETSVDIVIKKGTSSEVVTAFPTP